MQSYRPEFNKSAAQGFITQIRAEVRRRLKNQPTSSTIKSNQSALVKKKKNKTIVAAITTTKITTKQENL